MTILISSELSIILFASRFFTARRYVSEVFCYFFTLAQFLLKVRVVCLDSETPKNIEVGATKKVEQRSLQIIVY